MRCVEDLAPVCEGEWKNENTPSERFQEGCGNHSLFVSETDSDTQYLWKCVGRNQVLDCAEDMRPKCVNYTTTQHASQPTNTCSIGDFDDSPDTATAWKWSCKMNGLSRNCAASKELSCKNYTGNFASQPATNQATGCNAGIYEDIADTNTYFAWSCRSELGNSIVCQVEK